eukprot:996296-Alexandrium_andersonii.AAC.1
MGWASKKGSQYAFASSPSSSCAAVAPLTQRATRRTLPVSPVHHELPFDTPEDAISAQRHIARVAAGEVRIALTVDVDASPDARTLAVAQVLGGSELPTKADGVEGLQLVSMPCLQPIRPRRWRVPPRSAVRETVVAARQPG